MKNAEHYKSVSTKSSKEEYFFSSLEYFTGILKFPHLDLYETIRSCYFSISYVPRISIFFDVESVETISMTHLAGVL